MKFPASLMLTVLGCLFLSAYGFANVDKYPSESYGLRGQDIGTNTAQTGNVGLCEGNANANGTGCAEGVLLSDVVEFTAVFDDHGRRINTHVFICSDADGTNDVTCVMPTPDVWISEDQHNPENTVYQPRTGQPGFVANSVYVYHVSDTPEPSTLLLLGSGTLALGVLLRNRLLART